MDEVLKISSREELRRWYVENAARGGAFMLAVNRGRVPREGVVGYVDAVEEALCFGYIDSTTRRIDGVTYNRFSPRRRNSHWTELNRARCRRLERLGLMTEMGRRVIPQTEEVIGGWITEEFMRHEEAYLRFVSMPRLYQRIKLSNIHFTDTCLGDHEKALRQLDRLVGFSLSGKFLGDWDDGGRLTDLDC